MRQPPEFSANVEFNLMMSVKHDSPWGLAIRAWQEDPTPAGLTALMDQLRSQAIDNPVLMETILGETLVKLLLCQ
jgi:hypothetical protein